MSLLPQLESDLLAAARKRSRPRLTARRSLVLALGLIALLAVPALAVTGAFKGHRPDVVSTLTGCSGPAVQQGPPPSTKPPAPDLLRMLGILRRPRTPADALPNARMLPFARPNLQATRFVRKDADGTRYYLGPVDNLRWDPPIPNKPGCRVLRFQRERERRAPEPGVCLFVFGREQTGGTCGTADSITRGLTTEYGGGTDRHGVTHVSLTGIAPDGVVSVTVRLPKRPALRLPVIGNVYATSVKGAAATPLLHGGPRRISFHYSDGRVRQVGPDQLSRAERREMLRQQRVIAQRDRHAGRTPSVFPPSGGPRKVFTLRVRVPFPTRARQTYVITLRGPEPGRCRRQLVFLTSAEPQLQPQRRPRRIRRRGLGLLKYGFGAYNVAPGRVWCRGNYRGSVAFAPNGARRGPRHIVGRFSFRVR